MACINMYSSEGLGAAAPPAMSPRISFSSDFMAEVPQAPRVAGERPLTDPNFEFAVGGRPMMAADELFFKGRLLPLTRGGAPPPPPRVSTLREELMADDEWDAAAASPARAPAVRGRWKELLGLRKPTAATAARRHDGRDSGASCNVSVSRSSAVLLDEDTSGGDADHGLKPTQDICSEGGAVKEPELELC